MEPPHRVIKKTVKMITDGIEMINVVVWKNVLIAVPMPVIYIWWAQTMKERKPIANRE